MNNRKYIREIFRVVSIDSILIIDKHGNLRRLYCPFRVIVVIPVGEYKPGIIVFVEAIKMTEELKDVFIIGGKAYYLVYFRIMLDDP